MASGDTNIKICNQALNLLGADIISSFTDTTNDAASVCNNIYETVKKQTLSLYPWSFALVKEQLNRSTATPVNEPKATPLQYSAFVIWSVTGSAKCQANM